ncbi:MAG: WbqC family protein [Patescibacteria group bacterium]
MKLAIMQPYFFPYIGYFQLIDLVDQFVIYDDVNFIKKGWINRNNILVDEKNYLITLPLEKVSQNKLINEIKISDDKRKLKKILNIIFHSYKKAPYFEEMYPIITSCIQYEPINLVDYLTNSLKEICKYLNIKTNLILSSDIEKDNQLKGQEKILEICKIRKANHYINPIGGMEIYDREKFNRNEIKINFLKTENILYNQKTKEFIPNLSIIDVIMFNSKEESQNLLTKFSLV